jgi:hypothetical protein
MPNSVVRTDFRQCGLRSADFRVADLREGTKAWDAIAKTTGL